MAVKKTAKTASVKNEGVYVIYCKLPCGMSFPLPSGKKVVLNGSNHKDGDHSLTILGYGRTEVAIDDWDWIMSVYGSLKIFNESNPVVFAAEDVISGDSAAREFGVSVKTGLEQRSPKEIIKTAEKQAGNKQVEE